MKNLFKKIAVFILLIAVFASCNNDDDIPSGEGAVSIKITDAPFPFEFVKKANVGIAKVELKNAKGEYAVVFEGNSNFNMVVLTNGSTKTVAKSNIKKGTYSEARITLNAASVQLSNGTNYDLNTDAQGSYTFSVNPALVVEEGGTSNILFDLDVNESFTFQGSWFGQWVHNIANITGCGFHADFRVCDLDQTGSIEGKVTVNGTPVKNAYVYVSVNGKKIATHTKADGTYKFIGIKEGSYTVTVKTEADGSASASNVQVKGTGTATCTLKL
jgi:hypothetical protein